MEDVEMLFPWSSTRTRQDRCDFCKASEANVVGEVDYFGLGDFFMCQCPNCGLVSIDPLPSSEIVQEGCTRIYHHNADPTPSAEAARGFSKSYRRGALFARNYLSHFRSPRVLEIGPGDGYFSAGIAAELGGANVTLVDIVPDLGDFYATYHPETEFFCGEFPNVLRGKEASFDLIVFRDLLEHTLRPFTFLKSVTQFLSPGGLAFFITPNGREDFWLINQRHLSDGSRTLMLLNHFHYFLPQTLQSMMEAAGLARREGFKYGLKHHRRGLGWKQQHDFPSETVPEVQVVEGNLSKHWAHDKDAVRRGVLNNLGPVSKVYSRMVDRETEQVPWDSPHGSEFFVIGERP